MNVWIILGCLGVPIFGFAWFLSRHSFVEECPEWHDEGWYKDWMDRECSVAKVEDRSRRHERAVYGIDLSERLREHQRGRLFLPPACRRTIA